MLSMPEALHHAIEVARATLPVEPEDLNDLKWRLEHTTPRAHQPDRKALVWLGFALWEELTRRQRPYGNAGDVLAILREAEGPDTDRTPLRPPQKTPEEVEKFRKEYEGEFRFMSVTKKCTVDDLKFTEMDNSDTYLSHPNPEKDAP